MWDSSNPALNNNDAFGQFYGREMFATRPTVATLQGVVNKTAILVGIAVIAGSLGYWAVGVNTSVMWISAIASLLITLGIYFVIAGKPQLSPFLAPGYAVVEGFFLGALTGLAEYMLLSNGVAVAGGVALQAFIITISMLIAMLALYKARILRPSRTFTAVIMTLTAGIMICYLLSFVMALAFGVSLPLISMGSAFQTHGAMALVGLGVNVVILIIASLWLIIDFGMIEEKIEAGSPRYMEWYCGFALLVTLAWIYFEAVKLVVRLASLLNRD